MQAKGAIRLFTVLPHEKYMLFLRQLEFTQNQRCTRLSIKSNREFFLYKLHQDFSHRKRL